MTAPSGLTLAHTLLNLRIPDLLERDADNGERPNFLPTLMKMNQDGSVGLVHLEVSSTEVALREARSAAAGHPWALVLDGKGGDADTPNLLGVFYGDGAQTGSVAFPYALPLRFGAALGPNVAEARRFIAQQDAAGTHLRAAFEAQAAPAGARLQAWTPGAVDALDGPTREALTNGFGVVALWIAASDGRVDEKEVFAMFDWIAARSGGPADVLFRGGAAQFKAVLEALMKGGRAPKERVVEAFAKAREHLERDARRQYTDALIAFATHIANASGGSFFAFWKPKVGAEETKVLTLLAVFAEVANAAD